jgi:hypothetical protein
MLAILFVFLFSKMIITYFSTFYSFLFNYLNRKMGSKNNEIKLTKFVKDLKIYLKYNLLKNIIFYQVIQLKSSQIK